MSYSPLKVSALLLLVALCGCDYAEPETHLIPRGYTGPVFIVHGRSQGRAKSNEKERRLYKIPKSGLLLTQFGSNDGIQNDEYYYIDSSGQRRAITGRTYSTVHDTPENRADSTVGIHSGGVGVLGEAQIPYTRYFIGTKSDLLDYKGPWGISEFLRAREVGYDSLRSAI